MHTTLSSILLMTIHLLPLAQFRLTIIPSHYFRRMYSLDQDAYGHVFYDAFADLLLLRSTSSSAPSASPSRGISHTAKKRVSTTSSTHSHPTGTTRSNRRNNTGTVRGIHPPHGQSDGDYDYDYDDDDDSDDDNDDGGWRPSSRTYPGASSRNGRIDSAGMNQSVGRSNWSVRKGWSSPPSGSRAASLDGDSSKGDDNGFVGYRRAKQASPIPFTRAGGGVGVRAAGSNIVLRRQRSASGSRSSSSIPLKGSP